MSKNDGGPAFPKEYDGMTLRDYFAAAALTGLVSIVFKFVAGEGNMTAAAEQARDQMAPVAYSIADTMLAERDEP